MLLAILNERLQLPQSKLQGLHRLDAVSGDQVRFVKAPPQPKDDRRTALGAHTDFGSVTVLFNKLGGLQVRLPAGVEPVPPKSSQNGSKNVACLTGAENGEQEQWVYVHPLPGHAIINLGDAMVKFSAGILRSNIHRVVSPPGAQAETTRFSLVYFSRPEDDVLLGPLKESPLVAERAGAGDEEVISSKDWILRRALGRRGKGKFEDSEGTETARGVRG
jgi:isopenicillin N synthase-like dioxygenase